MFKPCADSRLLALFVVLFQVALCSFFTFCYLVSCDLHPHDFEGMLQRSILEDSPSLHPLLRAPSLELHISVNLLRAPRGVGHPQHFCLNSSPLSGSAPRPHPGFFKSASLFVFSEHSIRGDARNRDLVSVPLWIPRFNLSPNEKLN